MKKTVPLMLALLCVLSACGGDDGGEETNSGGSGGAGGGGDSGNGSGGTSGTTGGSGGTSTGTGGTGGSGGSAGPIMCGSAMCEAPAQAMGFITPCCADEAMSTCGISLLNSGCMATPESDPRCPGIDVGGVFEIASCCDMNNLCGIDASFLNMGCIDLQTAAEEGMGQGGMGIDFELPQPRTCDGMLIDAGMPDDDAGM